MAPAAARYRLVVVARAVFLATFLSAAATAATEASACADESTLVASLRRVQATMEDPFGVLQRSWVDPSKLCGGRPAGVMGSDANGGWWGVTCDAEDPPCVKKLYLAGKSFRGEVRAVLAAVADAVGSSVEYLHLGSNRLTAPLPGPPLPLPLPLPPAPGAEVGMGMAEASSVAANDANNAIFGFQALKYLYLDTNDIEAPLNDTAGSALMSDRSPPLAVLSLHQNRLTGAIPPEVGQLTGLEWLNLGWNRLSGPVPDELLELKNLKWCWLAANQLSGEFPGSGVGELERALPQLRSLKVDGNERLRGCLPLDPCQSTARQQEGEQGLVVEASYTEVTDCSCPDDKAAAYPPYSPDLPPPPRPPLNPASPPPVLYEYLVRGNATLEGYTADTFGAAERGWFASGLASVTPVGAEAVSVTSVRPITITSTAAAAGDGNAQRTVTTGDEALMVGAAGRAEGGRRLLGSDTLRPVTTEAALVDFVVTVTERNTAEAVIASVIAAAQPRAEGAATLLDALMSAGLSSLVGLSTEIESDVESRQIESPPPAPPPLPPAAAVDPNFPGGLDFNFFSGIFDLFPWPVAAWPWIWVLRDGRWFTVVQIFTTLGTF